MMAPIWDGRKVRSRVDHCRAMCLQENLRLNPLRTHDGATLIYLVRAATDDRSLSAPPKVVSGVLRQLSGHIPHTHDVFDPGRRHTVERLGRVLVQQRELT